MQDQNESVKVFVAFVRGVAMVLPEFATRMIHLLGASPAETVVVREPEVIIRRSRKTTGGLVVSGTSITGSIRYDQEDYGWRNQPRKSWKTYRASQYRVAA